ncbi:hypothetical protein [Paenibacillus thalictri]|uniref:Uncharacterized protein n=1 Tax=Paenibacillus thalictri TaxID=2527873 RepID=A0A4Q9DPD1_9BACL|nr:hypothetical protein [Paenibacillus thalictri]TBL78130.1 hypothetical protein EYB31_14695 [Paenibacillus thalictri]
MLKKSAILAAIISLGLLASACTDHAKIKSDLLTAAAKQSELASYRFEGSALLNLHLNADPSAPLTTALLSFVKTSKLEWKGVSSSEPRMETTLKITPENAGNTSMEIPALFKDGKWYFSLPPIHKNGEFSVLDMSKITGNQTGKLSGSEDLMSALLKQVLGAVDAKWVNQTKEPVTLPDQSSARQYTIEMNESNAKELNTALNAAVPGMTEWLKTNGWAAGLINPGQIELQAPSSLSFAVDEKGFIREQRYQLYFTLKQSSGKPEQQHVELRQYISDVNTSPAFEMPVPADAKPLNLPAAPSKQP